MKCRWHSYQDQILDLSVGFMSSEIWKIMDNPEAVASIIPENYNTGKFGVDNIYTKEFFIDRFNVLEINGSRLYSHFVCRRLL